MKFNYLTALLAASLLIVCFTRCGSDDASSNADQKNPNDQTQPVQPLATDQTDPTNDFTYATPKGAIQPPIRGVDVHYTLFPCSANKGGEFEMGNGTKIQVPENCFVDKNGKTIKGAVDLKYREFHTIADIIASGIPMTYDSGGVSINFESAGMFEMKAVHKGEEVAIAQGKNIDISMASFKEGNDFNFYRLDEQNGDWQYKGTKNAVANTNRTTNLNRIEKEVAAIKKPPRISPYDPTKLIFDLDFDYKRFPDLELLAGVMWQYAGEDKETDPEVNPQVLQEKWANVKVLPHEKEVGVYWVSLNNRTGDKSFTMPVRPVMKGKSIEKANAKFQKMLAKYNEALRAKEIEKERVAAEAELLRSFQISDMGIYNYDKQWKSDKVHQLLARFDFGMNVDLRKFPVSVFLVLGDENAVIRYVPSTYDKFSFDPTVSNKLVAILPGNRTATFSAQDFKSINTRNFRKGGENQFTFKMKLGPEKLESVDKLGDVIASL
jgi:hypothetical protein